MNSTIAVIQARATSTRLPRKVLAELGTSSVLEQVYNQLSFSKLIHHIVIATSDDPSDDAVYETCLRGGMSCFRGSLEDVLSRFLAAAESFRAQEVVRVTADCPLIDPEICDQVIELFFESKVDYASNINPPTYPDGLDTEVISMAALRRCAAEATLPTERQHVTQYVRFHPDRFKVTNLFNSEDLSKFRWTLDNEEDHRFLKKVYSELEQPDSFISWRAVLRLLQEQPELATINAHIPRDVWMKEAKAEMEHGKRVIKQ